MTQYVYTFDQGDATMKQLLGGKGANLAEMTRIGIPVPPGFTLTTQVCERYYADGQQLSEEVVQQVRAALTTLEQTQGKGLGDASDPLLVSIRSGAAASMPGMMDTVLNLGLNDVSVEGLAAKSGNERFAYDSYRRFLQMFGDVVLGVEHAKFEMALDQLKQERSANDDTQLTADDLKTLVSTYKRVIADATGKPFTQEPFEQLLLAIKAVLHSWNNERAIFYRRLNDLQHIKGTAVNVQAMVFGNRGETSGTGVCFTRDPSTGENRFYGEYLMNAQGEDVVAGIRTPKRLETLNEQNPTIYAELDAIRAKLEQHYTDMQDMEFTIEEGTLYLLQTRTGKRTAAAAVKIAIDMLAEGLIDEKTAVLRVEPNQLNQLLHPQIDPAARADAKVLAKGLPASPGAAVGKVVFDAHEAHRLYEEGEQVILVRTETSPEDLIGMDAARGILTSRGGMTSHAAVVARGMGKCCIAGCDAARIDEQAETLTLHDTLLGKGDWLTLDGSTGEVLKGRLATKAPELSGDFAKLMELADKHRTLKIRTNADTPKDATIAVRFGAEGIGLCRTEHMFFEGDRIKAMRRMILAESEQERVEALETLLPYQREDFEQILRAMGGRPVTIRLLDPPLHEFLPQEEADQRELAGQSGKELHELQRTIRALHEVNPMLGHRGCRLGITYPEITRMQTRAIIEAAIAIKKEGIDVVAEIMVPLVGNVKELAHQRSIIDETAKEVLATAGVELRYLVGTMIEVPRGALTADAVAEHADFFSFGTNDLTQMGCGFSRDDAGRFLKQYVELGIYEKDPFEVLDQDGVGELVRIAVEKGRGAKQTLKLGICGEHGGEPSSIAFCHRAGLDYVSCSPYRVPIARLAAAHAALKG